MALPDTDKVIQELNRRFAESLPEFYQRRIIFWHDEDRDFEEKIQSGEIELANAKLVVLDETNNFEKRNRQNRPLCSLFNLSASEIEDPILCRCHTCFFVKNCREVALTRESQNRGNL